jgi:hypothetical protein
LHDRLFEHYEILLALAPVKYMLGGLVVHPDSMVRSVRLTDGVFEYGGRHDGSGATDGSRESARQDLRDLYCGFSRERAAYRPVDEESEIRKIFDRQALARLLDPTGYVGSPLCVAL